MKILFTFENALPSTEADAEVFVTTAQHLAPRLAQSWLHVPLPDAASQSALAGRLGLAILRARAPLRPAALRHICCGLTLVLRPEFRQADLIYTRNLWIAWIAVLLGQRVAFDHYRPWPDQIPPLQPLLHRLMRRRKFLINICHSDYTRASYRALGVPAEKLCTIHNGFDPARLSPPLSVQEAKRDLAIPAATPTVVYTGRLNHKKGLGLLIQAARHLPDTLFLLVGSYGPGPIEALAAPLPNIRIVPFQPPEALRRYIYAADILLIPPSWKPLAEFGSTVLPLKLFLYMAAGRPILAGTTPDILEILHHAENAYLCPPDDLPALIDAITALIANPDLASRLAATAQVQSAALTWENRAASIAALLTARLAATPAPSKSWTRAQYGAWLKHSARWLRHLLAQRSWVLPPDIAAPHG